MKEIFIEIDNQGFTKFDLSHHRNKIDYELFKKIIKECNLEDELFEFVKTNNISKSSNNIYPVISDNKSIDSPRYDHSGENNRRNSSSKKI